MFNLTVDEAHTFYVGKNGWLVHNATRIRVNIPCTPIAVPKDDSVFNRPSGWRQGIKEDVLAKAPGPDGDKICPGILCGKPLNVDNLSPDHWERVEQIIKRLQNDPKFQKLWLKDPDAARKLYMDEYYKSENLFPLCRPCNSNHFNEGIPPSQRKP